MQLAGCGVQESRVSPSANLSISILDLGIFKHRGKRGSE